MNRTILIAVTVAALIVTTGLAAAVPGGANAPADANEADGLTTNASETNSDQPTPATADRQPGDGHAADDHPADTDDHPADTDDHPADTDDRAGDPAENRADRGPPSTLPDQVPDHVSTIHERISSFLSGDLEETLGDAISEVTPGSSGDDDQAEDGDDAADTDDDADDPDAAPEQA